MKLAVISTIVYPSTLANRIHLLSMVRAFAKNGHDVSLLCRSIEGEVFSEKIKVSSLGCTRSIFSAWRFAKFLKDQNHDAWFAREPHLLLLTIIFFIVRSFRKPPYILYEVHDIPRDYADGLVLQILKLLKNFKIITITNGLKNDLVDLYNLHTESILVLPDGVDLERFKDVKLIERKSDRPLVLYSGSLYEWKGVFALLEVAMKMPNIDFWFLGGSKVDIEAFKIRSGGLANVTVLGHVAHQKVPGYLLVADVLVLPNSAKYRMSEQYTSPLKLFEYMASKKPIVASDLPSIREILTDGINAYLVKPDSQESLALGIEKALNDLNQDKIISKAFSDVQGYTWEKRALRIIDSVNT